MESFDIYAQVLAAEDLRVVYNDKVHTACFNLETRTIVMPTFDWADNDVRQMLLSHEVSHAIFTDFSMDKVVELKNRYRKIFNIIEDIRVENCIQQKFPGLRDVFKRGYNTCFKNGMFGTSILSDFAERLNVFFKSRFAVNPGFSEDELALFNKLINLTDISQVESICESVFQLMKEEKLLNDNAQPQEQPEEIESQELNSKEEDEWENVDMPSDGNPDLDESEENNEDYQSNQESNDENAEDTKDNASESEAESEESVEKSTENIESIDENGNNEEESEEQESGSGKKSDEIADGEDEENENSKDFTYEDLEDRSDFEKNINQMSDASIHGTKKFMIINESLSIEYETEVFSRIVKRIMDEEWLSPAQRKAIRGYADIAKRGAQYANMIFSQMKSAKNRRMTKNRMTGTINPRNLYKYKTSDNPQIFKQLKITPNGQNHGIVILLDCSGSIKNVLPQVILNGMVLAEFCVMQKIPFEVFTFGLMVHGYCDYDNVCSIANSTNYSPERLALLSPEFKKVTDFQYTGTPMIKCLFAIDKTLAAFKRNGIEKTHMVICTDGSPTDNEQIICEENSLNTFATATDSLIHSCANALNKNLRPIVRFNGIDIMKDVNLKSHTVEIDVYGQHYTRINEKDFIFNGIFNYYQKVYNTNININFICDLKETSYHDLYAGLKINRVLPYLNSNSTITHEMIDELENQGTYTFKNIPEYINSYAWTRPVWYKKNYSGFMRSDPLIIMQFNKAIKEWAISIAKAVA